MPSYDLARFSPPAPCTEVMLKDIDTGRSIDRVVLLIDSGADVSALPRNAVSAIGTPEVAGSSYEVQGFDGRTSLVQTVKVDLVFLNRTFRGRFLLTDNDWGILGRDILNLVAILLDGPRQVWEESSKSTS